MPLCPNGSSVNPSAPPYVWITWLDAQSWLGNLFAKFGWIAQLFDPILVNTATFCTTEPNQPVYPGDPSVVFTGQDPLWLDKALQYIKDSAIWWVWHNQCQCNASGNPGCTTFIFSHSADLSSTYDWDPLHAERRFSTNTSGLTLWGLWVDTHADCPGQIYWRDIPTTINSFQPVNFVTGWQYYAFNSPLTITVGKTYSVGLRVNNGLSGAHFFYQTGTQAFASPLIDHGEFGGDYAMSFDNPSTNLTGGIDPVICVQNPNTYTPAAPPVPTTTIPDLPTPTCTSIGDLCSLLSPTKLDLSVVLQRLDLLQRRLLPFAWIAQPSSNGLTGAGSITVQDVLGCIVTLTTVPLGWGSTTDVPRRLVPKAGEIQASDGTNRTDEHQVHYEHQVILFNSSWATQISYSFRPGFVATITPIKPEP